MKGELGNTGAYAPESVLSCEHNVSMRFAGGLTRCPLAAIMPNCFLDCSHQRRKNS